MYSQSCIHIQMWLLVICFSCHCVLCALVRSTSCVICFLVFVWWAMSNGTRRQFSAAFKIKGSDFVEMNINMAAQHHFGVSEKSAQYWRAQKRKLLACNSHKTLFHGHRSVHPQLEDALSDFGQELRARSLPVAVQSIRCKAAASSWKWTISKFFFCFLFFFSHFK